MGGDDGLRTLASVIRREESEDEFLKLIQDPFRSAVRESFP